MKIMSKDTKIKLSWAAVVGSLALLFISLFTLGFRQTAPALEIRLVAKGMAFFVEGESQPNPDLYIPPGKKVLLTFINQDRGIDHDVVFPQFEVSTGKVKFGESALLELKPRTVGEFNYLCSLHAAMMRGKLIVTE